MSFQFKVLGQKNSHRKGGLKHPFHADAEGEAKIPGVSAHSQGGPGILSFLRLPLRQDPVLGVGAYRHGVGNIVSHPHADCVGIGVNTGPAYLGSLGSETFKKFTAIGHTVNLAARLCGVAKKYQVLFTENTKKLIAGQNFNYESIGRVSFKGVAEPIEVFALKY